MKGVYQRPGRQETSERLALLKKMQKEPLEFKIAYSRKIIHRAFEKGTPALLYSGGRDSTVLLSLLREAKPEILVIHNDTTLGSQENLDFIRKMTTGMNYVETRAQDPIRMWRLKGYYPILSKRGFTRYKKQDPSLQISPVQCCYQLKELYANRVMKDREVKVVFWGNRAGESNRRKFSFVDNGFLFKPKKYKWWQAYPIQHWTDGDIDAFLKKRIPQYPANGNFENGCLCCGTDITFYPNTLSKLYLHNKAEWEKFMRAGFAEQIAKIKGLGHIPVEDLITKRPETLMKV